MPDGATDPGAPEFGVLLRALRAERRLTQEQLSALAAPVSVRTIQDLERGKNRSARQATALDLARALELTGVDRRAFLNAAAGSPRPRPTTPPSESPVPSVGTPPTERRNGSDPGPPTGDQDVFPSMQQQARGKPWHRRRHARTAGIAVLVAVVLTVTALVVMQALTAPTTSTSSPAAGTPPLPCLHGSAAGDGLAAHTTAGGIPRTLMRNPGGLLTIGQLGRATPWTEVATDPLTSAPAFTELGDGTLAVYTAECQHTTLHRTVVTGTTTSGWEAVATATPVGFPPAVVETPDGVVFVFYVDDRGDVYAQTTSTGARPGGWEKIGSGLTSGVVGIVRSGTNDVQIFSRDEDGNVIKALHQPSAGWSDWSPLVPPVAMAELTTPGVAVISAEDLELAILGHNGHVFDVQWHKGKWGRWTDLGAPGTGLVSSPVVVFDGADAVTVAVRTSGTAVAQTARPLTATEWPDWSEFET